MRRTLALAGIGIAIGVAGSLALARLMRSLLYGIEATDPFTFAATAGLLFLVALGAGYLPALRASRVHPATALQES